MNGYISVPKYGSAFGGQQDMMIKQNKTTKQNNTVLFTVTNSTYIFLGGNVGIYTTLTMNLNCLRTILTSILYLIDSHLLGLALFQHIKAHQKLTKIDEKTLMKTFSSLTYEKTLMKRILIIEIVTN